jgi:AraC-like DNA-binding protein
MDLTMKITRYIPAKTLRPFIKTFMIIESDDGMENKILPDTSLVMAFRLRGHITDTAEILPSSAITGLRNAPRLVEYSKDAATLLVIFTEGGAAAFFPLPLHELFGSSIPLDNFIDTHQIEDQLMSAANNEERINIIQRFMLSMLRTPQSDALVLSAIQQIKNANGDLRIKDLLSNLYISQDAFEKRFRKITGASPKQFAGTIRLKNIIAQYSETTNLTEIAYSAGYFDQAHFIKTFKSFTGQTPHSFFTTPARW